MRDDVRDGDGARPEVAAPGIRRLERALAARDLEAVADQLTDRGLDWLADEATRPKAERALRAVLDALGLTRATGTDDPEWMHAETLSWLARLSLAVGRNDTAAACADLLCAQRYPSRIHWVEGRCLKMLMQTPSDGGDRIALEGELERFAGLISDVAPQRLRSLYALLSLVASAEEHIGFAERFAERAQREELGPAPLPLPSGFDAWRAVRLRSDLYLGRTVAWALRSLDAAQHAGFPLRIRYETYNLVEMLIDQGRIIEAKRFLYELPVDDRPARRWQLNMASILEAEGELAAAVAMLDQLLEHEDAPANRENISVRLAMLNVRLGLNRRAEALLDVVTLRSPQRSIEDGALAVLAFWSLDREVEAKYILDGFPLSSMSGRELALVQILTSLVDDHDAWIDANCVTDIARLLALNYQTIGRHLSHIVRSRTSVL